MTELVVPSEDQVLLTLGLAAKTLSDEALRRHLASVAGLVVERDGAEATAATLTNIGKALYPHRGTA